MRFICQPLLAVVFSACTSQQNSESFTTRASADVLTDSVIAVSADTAFLETLLDLNSDEDILARFGNRITHKEQFSSEVDGSWLSTQLFPGSRNEVTFEWQDSENFKNLYRITINGTDSDWRTKPGIRLGMKLSELEKLNGKPFQFYYFGWNFEGEVFWNEGALANHGVYVVVRPRENSHVDPGLYSPQASEKISSDSEASRNSDLIVTAISLRKNE